MGVPQGGDVYLLCSDGLTKMLPDEVIAKVMSEETDLKAAVERLIREANERGGKDNVTVVLVRVAAPERPAATGTATATETKS
jgi:PPM family protein phosphatase